MPIYRATLLRTSLCQEHIEGVISQEACPYAHTTNATTPPTASPDAQGESRCAGKGGAAMSGDGQHLEAWKKAGECRDFPQPWSDYLWSLEFEHRPGDAKPFIRRFAAVCLSWSKISYPKSALLLLPQQPNGETPPTRTAIAPNYLTFYFLQIRTAGSFDKEPP